MIQPPLLQLRDTIGLVAPGRKLDAATIQETASVIESWGYRIRLGKNMLSEKHSYMSGSDVERQEDMQTMLDDPAIRAIICVRGGYGTTRILDQLDFSTFLQSPKWICGFSDITALHLKLQALKVQSIHSTMPVLFLKSESSSSVEALRKMLVGEKINLQGLAHQKNIPGEARGAVVGGNLALIADSLGTTSEIDSKNKILIIEEFDEYYYRIDRMINQLKRAKKLDSLAGLVIGHTTELKESELPFGESFEEIVLNHVREFGYPVGFGFQTGHENPNLPWIQGSEASLAVSKEKSVLAFL